MKLNHIILILVKSIKKFFRSSLEKKTTKSGFSFYVENFAYLNIPIRFNVEIWEINFVFDY